MKDSIAQRLVIERTRKGFMCIPVMLTLCADGCDPPVTVILIHHAGGSDPPLGAWVSDAYLSQILRPGKAVASPPNSGRLPSALAAAQLALGGAEANGSYHRDKQ